MRTAFIGLGLLLAFAAATVTTAIPIEATIPPPVSYHDWEDVKNVPINGVYPPCRLHWLWNAQRRQFAVQNTTCPFGSYAADIVDHTIKSPLNVHIDGFDCGKWIEGNSGQRGSPLNAINHAEVEAHNRLMNCNIHPELCSGTGIQLNAQNKDMFSRLTMYTTGESCALDATMETLSGYGEVIYGVSARDQLKHGWPLPDIDSRVIYDNTRTPTRPKFVIANVDTQGLGVYYFWQFDNGMPCPAGCQRNSLGTTCVKMVL